MLTEHAAAVLAIYQAGIDEGNATFETRAPAWEQFTRAKLAGHRYVARAGGHVLGWVAVSAVSERCVYGGVVEHSVYVSPGARGRGIGRPAPGCPGQLHRSQRDLDHPERDLSRERRQRRAAPGRGVPHRGDPRADRPASWPLA